MPRATVTTDTVRHELKTCPDAFVVLKPMSYGTKLGRSDQAMKMTMKAESGPRKRGQAQNSETQIEMLQRAATQIDFQSCIVDHNLEDETGRKLDFRSFSDIDMLDPKIGEEISTLIDELNNFAPPTENNPEGEAGN
jgi:hypothetical protein